MMTFRYLTIVVALLAATLGGTAAAQYRWTDANGRVVYGDRPPSDAKDVRALTTRPAATPGDGSSPLPFELRRAVERAPVVVYTGPDCAPCAPATALLRDRGVPFTERTVASPDDLQEFRRLSGGLRLPHVTVGSQAQSGFNADTWSSMLDAAGYPKGSMLPRSFQWPAPQPLVPPPAQADAKASGTATAEPVKAAEPVKR